MKLSLLTIVFAIYSLLLSAQTNFALYSIEETRPICIAPGEDIMYGITWKDENESIISYKLKDGSIIKKYSSELPKNPIKLMISHPKKSILYLITARKIDDTKNIYFDAIYSFNTKTDKLKLLYTEGYNYHCPYRIGLVDGNLIFTAFEEPTRKYNIHKNYSSLLNPNTDYQLLSIAPKHNGYIMLNIRNMGENGKVPVFFMDSKNNFSSKVGFINPNIKIYSKNTNIQLQSLTIQNKTFQWFFNTLQHNRFPIYHFQIAMHPYWLKQAYTLDKVYTITAILDANDTYLIAKSGKDIVVYNHLEPQTTSPSNINEEDAEKIKAFLNERNDYERVVISSKQLSEVFDALFYYVYTKDKRTFIAIQQHGNYYKLKHYSQLAPLVKKDFVLNNEKQGLLMEEALEVLYPVDTFNKKYIKNYKTDNGWMFIRGESFDYKYGIEVKVDSLGKAVDFIYRTDL